MVSKPKKEKAKKIFYFQFLSNDLLTKMIYINFMQN